MRLLLVRDRVLQERDQTFKKNVHLHPRTCDEALAAFVDDVGMAVKTHNEGEHKQIFETGKGLYHGADPDLPAAVRILEAIDKAKAALHEKASLCVDRRSAEKWSAPSKSLQSDTGSRGDRRADLLEMQRIIRAREGDRRRFVEDMVKFEVGMRKMEEEIVWRESKEEVSLRGKLSIALHRAAADLNRKEKSSVEEFGKSVDEMNRNNSRSRAR